MVTGIHTYISHSLHLFISTHTPFSIPHISPIFKSRSHFLLSPQLTELHSSEMAQAHSTPWPTYVVLLLIIWGCIQICRADTIPQLVFPLDTDQESRDEMDTALKDAMTLARFVAITSTLCDEVRYISSGPPEMFAKFWRR